MLDIKLIRESSEIIRHDIEKRQDPEKTKLLDEVIKNDNEYRKKLQELEKLKHQRIKLSLEIAKLKREKKDDSKQLKQASEIPNKIKKLQEEILKIKEKVDYGLMSLPNLLHDSVPYGKDEHDNVEIRKFGKKPDFRFTPKSHLEILENLGLLDSERAAKVAGHGFYFFKGSLVQLDYAIIKYAIDSLVNKGYQLIGPPLMLRRKPYEGVVDLGDFENVMYKIDGDDLYLIATAEHAMGTMFMDEVISKKDLPIKLVGVSPCFRREVGTHGKYTKGLFRMHQFHKVEQFIFCLQEQSWDLHEELQKNAEELYEGLGLHFSVVNVCTGDIGTIASKKYDIEIWMADGKYREAGSNSNCTDYQARRLNVKYREKEGQKPVGYVHTLNNTALATSRTILSILEQFQQKDGSVMIPKALQGYMGIKKLEKA